MNLVAALEDAFKDDASWFNAVSDLIEDGANSHEIYDKLVEGLAAVEVTGGFPPHVFQSLLQSKLREVRERVS